MRRPADPGPRRGNVRRAVRWLAVANGVVLVILSVLSAANYTSVVVAHATVYVAPRYSLDLANTDSGGTLNENSTVTMRLDLMVVNPSGRTLRIHLIAYGGWIEDLPAEVGLPVARNPPDDTLEDANGTRFFYPVFLNSTEVEGDPIPPLANGTLRLAFVLSRSENPWAFDAVKNITDYAAAFRDSPTNVSWNHWVRVQIDIDGIPEATSPTASAYVRTLRRIERGEGVNLGAP